MKTFQRCFVVFVLFQSATMVASSVSSSAEVIPGAGSKSNIRSRNETVVNLPYAEVTDELLESLGYDLHDENR